MDPETAVRTAPDAWMAGLQGRLDKEASFLRTTGAGRKARQTLLERISSVQTWAVFLIRPWMGQRLLFLDELAG